MEFTAYETVARWAASFSRARASGRCDDRPRKLALLEQFCASVGVDPDTMVAKARADRDAKNGYLRELVAWAKALPGTDRQRHDAENTIRGFFMKNGFRVVTKPYSGRLSAERSVNVGELLTNTARSYPDRVGFIWEGHQRTYGESNRRADALAHALADLGVGRGDRVALSHGQLPRDHGGDVRRLETRGGRRSPQRPLHRRRDRLPRQRPPGQGDHRRPGERRTRALDAASTLVSPPPS